MRYKGVAMGVFLSCTGVFGTLGTLAIGAIVDDFHISHQDRKGWLLTVNTAGPCLIAAVFFYISSFYYAEYRANLVDEKD